MTTSRQDLKTVLKSIVGTGVNVYDYPPDSMKSPAVVVEAADPWIVDTMTGGQNRQFRMFYDVQVWVQRTTPRNAYAKLEQLSLDILLGLTDERWKGAEVSAPTTSEHGNVEYVMASIVVSARLEND